MNSSTTLAMAQPKPNPVLVRLGDYAADLARAASEKLPADVIVEMALHAAVKNPAILQCTQESLFLALADVARWQLSIGEGVYLVPFNEKQKDNTYKKICQAVRDYRGDIALLIRARIVSTIQPYAIYEGDHFEITYGLEDQISYRPCPAANRGKVKGAWLRIILPSGIRLVHHMDIADIEAIRKGSKSWGPDKVKHCPAWYAIKTCIKNWAARQPKSGTLGRTVAEDFRKEEILDTEYEEIRREPVPQGDTPATTDDAETLTPVPETTQVAREVRPATPNQKALLRQIAKSHVISDEEREQIELYLASDDLSFEDLGEKIDELHTITTDRKRAERAAQAGTT